MTESKPVVVVAARPDAQIIRALVEALERSNVPPCLFVRSGELVRVRRDEKGRPLIERVGEAELRVRIAAVARTVTINKDKVEIDKPVAPVHVKMILALGTWPFPPLEAVTEIPTLRGDGTIVATPGYDPATALVYEPDAVIVPTISESPTEAEVVAAVGLLDDVLADFPFEDDADRANTIGYMLTPLARPALGCPTPLALIDANQPGAGKGLLTDVVCTIATGRPTAAQALSSDDNEMRKLITSVLGAGQTMIVFDNVEGVLRSSSLAAALTANIWSDRVLGGNDMLNVANRATWAVTGNNIQVGGDIARRCYRIRLDAKMARPYERTGFRHPDLIQHTREHRGEILAALLTLARAWYAAGRPPAPDVPAMGGYSPWTRTIGGILHHAAITGWLTNVRAFMEDADADRDEWASFLTTWHERNGTSYITVKDLIADIVTPYSPMRDALPARLVDIPAKKFAGDLGNALKARVGRRYTDPGHHITKGPKNRAGAIQWRVDTDEPPCESDNVLQLNPAPRGTSRGGAEAAEATSIPTHSAGAGAHTRERAETASAASAASARETSPHQHPDDEIF